MNSTKVKIALYTAFAFELALTPALVLALPSGGSVQAGSAAIGTPAAGQMQVTQTSDRAVIDWRGFDIGAGERVNFSQPSASAVALNRVRGAGQSLIDGTLTANGKLFLVNPNGVIFGRGAEINTASFLATTSDIRNEHFMQGIYGFSQPGVPGAVIENYGDINVADTGFAALVAPAVKNAGAIRANLGAITLASGNLFAVDFYGDGMIQFAAHDAVDAVSEDQQALVHNSGSLVADGGSVTLSARAVEGLIQNVINMEGSVRARTAQMQNGMIVLDGGAFGVVESSGQLDASGRSERAVGGEVHVLGEKVGLVGNASVDVSGSEGGGTALIGGNYQGVGPQRTASVVYVGEDTVVDVSAVDRGDGGLAVVWSDDTTRFHGSISARGGSVEGDGGVVETSGAVTLNVVNGSVDASAPSGQAGDWLLDPADIDIGSVGSTAGVTDPLPGDDPFLYESDEVTTGFVAIEDIEAAMNTGTSVTVKTTDGSINLDFGEQILTTGTDSTLLLDASEDIHFHGRFESTAEQNGILQDWFVNNLHLEAGGNVFFTGEARLGTVDEAGFLAIGAPNGRIEFSQSAFADVGGGLFTALNDIQFLGNSRIQTGTGALSFIAGTVDFQWGRVSATTGTISIDVGTLHLEDDFSSVQSAGVIDITADSIINGGVIQGIENLFEASRDPSLVSINAGSIELRGGEIQSRNGVIDIDTAALNGNGSITLRDSEIEPLDPGDINISVNGKFNLGSDPDGESGTSLFVSSWAGPISIDAGEVELVDGAISTLGGFPITINTASLINRDEIFAQGGPITVTSLDGNGDVLPGSSILNLGSIIAELDEIRLVSGTIESTGVGATVPIQLGTALVGGEEPLGFTTLLDITATGDISLSEKYHGETVIARAGGTLTMDFAAPPVPLFANDAGTGFQSKILGMEANSINWLPGFSEGLDLDRIAVTLLGANESFTYNDPNAIIVGGIGDIPGASAIGDLTLSAAQDMTLAGHVFSAGANTLLTAETITGLGGPGMGTVQVSAAQNTTLTGDVSADIVALSAGDTLEMTDGSSLTANNLGIRAGTLVLPIVDGDGVLQTDVDVLALDIIGGDATVEDAGSLEIGDVGDINGVTATGSLAIRAAQDIVISSPVTSDQVILSAGNGISGAGGIFASSLGLRAETVNLSGGSDIDVLAAAISGEAFAFESVGNLTIGDVLDISGVAAANIVELTAGGDLVLQAGVASEQVALTAGGDISGEGSISAVNLGLRASGVDISNSGDVDVLAADISGNAFSFSDANNLTIGTVGQISGVSVEGVVALSAGGDLQLTAGVQSDEVALTAGGSISGAGNVTADRLGVRATTVDLANSGDVEVLAADISGESFNFSDMNDLIIGTVGDIDGVSAAGAVSLAAAGDLLVGAGVSSESVALAAGGSISGSGNVIANRLGLRAASVDLPGSGDVDVLAADISGESFSFNDTDDLTVGSVGDISGVSALDRVALAAGGDLLLLEGVVSDAVALSAGGQISGNGNVTAALLGLRADTVDLPNSSDVDVLAAEIRTGDFNYQDANGLSIGQVADIVGLNVASGNAGLDVQGALTVATSISVPNGDVDITADSVSFEGGDNSVAASGALRLRPRTAGASIGIAGGEGSFQVSQSSVEALADGFTQIAVGREDGSHIITVNAVSFSDPLLLQAPLPGGAININGQITALDNASVTIDGPGATTVLAESIVTSGESIVIDDSVVLAGDILLDTTAGGSVAQGGDIIITGPISGPGTLNATAGTAGDIDLVTSGSQNNPLQAIALSGANVGAGTVFADNILIFDSANAAGTLNAGSTLAFEGVSAFNVSATVNGVSGADLACNVPVDPLTGRQFINGAEVFAATGDLDNVLNYLSARGSGSWLRSDDDDTDTAAGEAFRTDLSKGGYVTNTFNKDYRLISKGVQLEPVFEDNPYIEDGFWESELDIRR